MDERLRVAVEFFDQHCSKYPGEDVESSYVHAFKELVLKAVEDIGKDNYYQKWVEAEEKVKNLESILGYVTSQFCFHKNIMEKSEVRSTLKQLGCPIQ